MKPLLLLSIALLSLPTVIFAQERVYSPLVNLGNAAQGNNVQSFEGYINFLYGLSIAIAALLAVIKIVIAGAKYMLSSVISAKGDALEDIRGAIVGLLVILSAVLILEFINPRLVNKDINFPQLDPNTRGSIQATQTTTNGQSNEDFTESLKAGTDACLQLSETQQSQDGTTLITRAIATNCIEPGQANAQLTIFERNCVNSGGRATTPARNSNILICTTPIEGASNATSFIESIANLTFPNSSQALGRDFVQQSGRVLTINVDAACDSYARTRPEDLRRMLYPSCLVAIKRSIGSICEGAYGRFNSTNVTSITCQTPINTRPIAELTEAFERYKADSAERRYYTIDNLSESEEQILCERYARGVYSDGWTENTCVFY